MRRTGAHSMTQMKVASHTTLRMVMVQDTAGDMVVMAEVTAADVVMGIVVAVATTATLVGEPTPLVIQTLLRAAPTPRLMVTHMDNDAQFLHDNLEQVDDDTGVYSDFVGYTYNHSGTSLLLDSCLTVNLITNKDLLHGIHKANTTMYIRCTAGVATTNLQGWLGDFPEPVWYIPQGS